jgi:hypothetical protein
VTLCPLWSLCPWDRQTIVSCPRLRLSADGYLAVGTAVMAEAAKVVPWINAPVSARRAVARRIRRVIWAAVDAGEITAEEVPLLVRSLLSS